MPQVHRIDATIEDISVANFVLMKAGMADIFKIAGYPELAPIPGYIAFTPKKQRSQKLADEIDTGMAKIGKSGDLNRILSKYGLKDWKLR